MIINQQSTINQTLLFDIQITLNTANHLILCVNLLCWISLLVW
jgi:hypothetical protein